MVSSIFTRLYNHPAIEFQNVLIPPQPREPHTCWQSLSIHPRPCYHRLILSQWSCLFCVFHISGIIPYMAFRIWLISLNMLSRFIDVTAFLSASFFFYGWLIFLCTDRPHFAYPFIGWWTFGWFLLFGYYEHSCTSFCENMFSVLLGYTLRSGSHGSPPSNPALPSQFLKKFPTCCDPILL